MYRLLFLSSAKKEFKKLDRSAQKLIKEKLEILTDNPEKLKNNIKPLLGEHKGKFRLRVHDYRIIFQIKNSELIITIIRVGHRREIY